jgi:3-oxoacyl-[acyl-carrier-protein] synthase II
MRRVVITGIGAITPIGNNVNDFWHSLINGVSGAKLITKFDKTNFKPKFACEVRNFDPSQTIETSEIRKYNLFTQYALATVHEAITNAEINFNNLNKDRIGVIWASGDGGISTFEEQFGEYKSGNGVPRFNPFFIPKRIINIASGVISIKYGLRGVNYTTASACSASNTAIIDAFNYIRWNKAVKENIIPPTINSENIEAEFADKFDFTLGIAKNKTINYALNNTFGFGGQHIASSIFKKFED